jgi:hypothetical protein
MKLTALMLCRNSDWCLGMSLRAALMWCDSVVVLAHACTDHTMDILMQVGEDSRRVVVLEEDSSVWEEMRFRQKMLDYARRLERATHIALIDDDEILTGNLLPTIRGHVESAPPGSILQLPWLCLRDGIGHVMTTGLWGGANVSTAFQDEPAFHWAARGGYDFHHRHPMGRDFTPYSVNAFQRHGGLMHLQFSSRRRLIAKQALYQCTEVLRWPGRMPVSQIAEMYGRTVQEADRAAVEPVPRSWWAPYEHLIQHLHVDAEPWQEAELRRVLKTEWIGQFAGLNFFGLTASKDQQSRK